MGVRDTMREIKKRRLTRVMPDAYLPEDDDVVEVDDGIKQTPKSCSIPHKSPLQTNRQNDGNRAHEQSLRPHRIDNEVEADLVRVETRRLEFNHGRLWK